MRYVDDLFRSYATENDLISPKGNYKTNAEVAYKYIKNNLDFVEGVDYTQMLDIRRRKVNQNRYKN